MKNRHTPGPWEYLPKQCAIVSKAEWFVEPDEENGEDGIRTCIVDLMGAMSGNDTGADAQLMAAAPELLEALKRIQNMFGYGFAQNNDDRIVNNSLNENHTKLRNLILHITSKAIAKAEESQ